MTRQNKTKQDANFRGNPLFQATNITKKQTMKRTTYLLPVGFFQPRRMCSEDLNTDLLIGTTKITDRDDLQDFDQE